MQDLTYQDVLAMLRLIETGSFGRLEIEYDGTRLKVERRSGTAPPPAPPPAASAAQPTRASGAPSPTVSSPVGPSPTLGAAPVSERLADALPGGVAVKPPMEGTFYASPAPGAPPYAEVGRRVRKGDQLGTVEVMKLFTPIASPCNGTVRAILVENQEVVAKDQTLMIVEVEA